MPPRPASPPRKILLLTLLLAAGTLHAETCVTQSQMKPADRDSLAAAARKFAALVQANDAATLRQQTLSEYARDFSGMASLVGATAPRLAGASLTVEQVYLLDASTLKTLADGTNQDAQFFCSLNKSMAEASFLIPALPPGRYAFVMVNAAGNKTPERLSFLLKQTAGQNAPPESPWFLAGFYPKPLTAAGRDGIWYWTQARELARGKQPWAAFLYYQQAQALLQPAGFVSSSHLDKLRKEIASAAPPALSDGISADAPLVVKGKAGADFRFTDLATDDSLNADKIDIVAHLAPDPPPDPRPDSRPDSHPDTQSKSEKKSDAKAAANPPLSPAARNTAAMSALLAAFPELRTLFHGVWIFADSPGQNPFITEQPMANIP